MPCVSGLYLLSSLDRASLGNVRVLGLIGPQGLPADPTGQMYALLNAVFYIAYAGCSKLSHQTERQAVDSKQCYRLRFSPGGLTNPISLWR